MTKRPMSARKKINSLDSKLQIPFIASTDLTDFLLQSFIPHVYEAVTTEKAVEAVARTAIHEIMPKIGREVQVAVKYDSGKLELYTEAPSKDDKGIEDRLQTDIDQCDKSTKRGIGLDTNDGRLGAVFVEDYENLPEYEKQILDAARPYLVQALEKAMQYEVKAKEARTDGLTKLLNKTEFEVLLTHNLKELKQANKRQEEHKGISLVMIDIDDFKSYNDTYGHDKGDNLLRYFGHWLSKSARLSDTVARVGGEEFAIIYDDCTYEDAKKRADEVRAEVEKVSEQLAEQGLLSRKVTFSAGVSHLSKQDIKNNLQIQGSELYRAADDALYRAKHDGKNRVY